MGKRRTLGLLLCLLLLLCTACGAQPDSDGALRCTVTIECGTVLAHMGDLSPGKAEIVPADGVLLPETAVAFSEGDTVRGTVRGVMDYGCFVELAPNLSGLTDQREDLREGDGVSVTIRSIRPERMKIKLQVIEVLPPAEPPETLPYWITDGVLDRWVYSPANCERSPVVTEFTEIP